MLTFSVRIGSYNIYICIDFSIDKLLSPNSYLWISIHF